MNSQETNTDPSESAEPLYHRIMSGESGPAWAPVRAALRAASWAYGAAVAVRNRRFDSDVSRVERVPVPVISVGNFTAGGTGKTPLVIDLVGRLQRMGHRAAVVSRGYRATPAGQPDELLLVQRHGQDVLTVAEPHRVRGAQRAVARGADVIVLDDAFQHRRIHRDLDIVVIDATRPFGYGYLLPRGLMREPPKGLRRAHLLVLSRADSVSPDHRARIEADLRRFNARSPLLCTRHAPTRVLRLEGDSEPLQELHARRVLCCAGIGNFAAFVQTVQRLGAIVCGNCALGDHAKFDRAQFSRLQSHAARTPDAELLLVTEKDLVKMDPALWKAFPLPIRALAVRIEFLDQGDAQLDRLLGSLLADRDKGADVHAQVSTR